MYYRLDASYDSPPNEKDLKVPDQEMHYISGVVQELGLEGRSPGDILGAVDSFFQEKFKYSLTHKKIGGSLSPLEDFLLGSRSGHCEYFATATVLILRASGIPARYASGYAVQEFSRLEDLFVVRARHAHAWVLVYDDGRWCDFDTTPASWSVIEGKKASMFEPVYDFMSFLLFRFSRWRWSEGQSSTMKYIGWLVIPLLVFLAWRLSSRKRIFVKGKNKGRIRDA